MNWFASPSGADAASAAWQQVSVQEWTPEAWDQLLQSLTPRQLVYQLRMWCLLAESAPELASEFEASCDQVRAMLRSRECAL